MYGLLGSAAGVPEDPDALIYITEYAIVDQTEEDAVNILFDGLKSDGDWAFIESLILCSPTRTGFTGPHIDGKRPLTSTFNVTWYGTSASTIGSTQGWKGVIGNSNLAQATWTLRSLFTNDDFGVLYGLNSYETGSFKGDIGNFIKAPWFRVEGFVNGTTTNFVTGATAAETHNGLVKTDFCFVNDNDGVRFQKRYLDGVVVGSRINSPSDILVGNPLAAIKETYLGNGNFSVGSGSFHADRRITYACHFHSTGTEALNDARVARISARLKTYDANCTAGGR